MGILRAEVWGPHMWFFLHTTAFAYPKYPNAVTKKIYYDLFQNIPTFIPVQEMAETFSKLLNEYPITPYLDDRDSLVKWTWFIHNKVNERLEKTQISLESFHTVYSSQYKQFDISFFEKHQIVRKTVYICILASFIVSVCFLYEK